MKKPLVVLAVLCALFAGGITFVIVLSRQPQVTPVPIQRPTVSNAPALLGEDTALVEGGVATSEHFILISSPSSNGNPSK